MNKLQFSSYDFFGYLISGYAVLLTLQMANIIPIYFGRDLKLFDQIGLIFSAYIFGHVIATPAKFLLEDTIVYYLLDRPSNRLISKNLSTPLKFIFPGYYKPLDENTKKKILEGIGNGLVGEDLFIAVRYHPLIVDDEKIASRLSGFLNLYGFCRNLSFTALIISLVIIFSEICGKSFIEIKYGILSFIIFVFLFYRYLKFYRQYSFEMFNSFSGRL